MFVGLCMMGYTIWVTHGCERWAGVLCGVLCGIWYCYTMWDGLDYDVVTVLWVVGCGIVCDVWHYVLHYVVLW